MIIHTNPPTKTIRPPTIMCLQMAARETGFGAIETYMHKGKLLALDLLLRVLSNPMHDWGHVRPLFAAELRQPLCVALLRNCMSPYDQVGVPLLCMRMHVFESPVAFVLCRAAPASIQCLPQPSPERPTDFLTDWLTYCLLHRPSRRPCASLARCWQCRGCGRA